jgi:putative transposase
MVDVDLDVKNGIQGDIGMPWLETCCVEERFQFVQEAESGNWAITELCRVYGVSRKTGYKWLARYRTEGVQALEDRSRARRSQPHAVPDAIRQLVVESRRMHRTWGPKKLRPWLERHHPGIELPSLTTMATILRGARLVEPQRRGRRLKGGEGGLGGEDRPNGVWATDFKGEFRLGNGEYCYPLTVTDACSRYVLACRGQSGPRGKPVQEAFIQLFRTYGVPVHIRSDNGSPFASRGAGRLTKLAVFWIDQGIELQRIRPGCPQENGRHERMHLTLKRETACPPARTMPGQQRRFNVFRDYFNYDRPHEALGQTCPSEHYEASNRAYDPRPPKAEYPGHYVVRSVRTDGQIKFEGELIYLSQSLIGKRVGLLEIDEDRWRVYYRHHPLGMMTREAREKGRERGRGRGRGRMRITPVPGATASAEQGQ